MGKILVIKGADFSAVAVGRVTPTGKTTVIVLASPTGGGTVTGGGSYDEGQKITISATPASEYSFLRWSDGNTQATRTITVGSTTETYTAIFYKTGWVSFNVTEENRRYVSGGSSFDAPTWSQNLNLHSPDPIAVTQGQMVYVKDWGFGKVRMSTFNGSVWSMLRSNDWSAQGEYMVYTIPEGITGICMTYMTNAEGTYSDYYCGQYPNGSPGYKVE